MGVAKASNIMATLQSSKDYHTHLSLKINQQLHDKGHIQDGHGKQFVPVMTMQ